MLLPHEFEDGRKLKQDANFRPDIIARVFKLKLDQLIEDIYKNKIFGRPLAYAYAIEFQKRGLPHAHILLSMHRKDKPQSLEIIDDIILAEIPEEGEELRKIILEHNMHKPYGHLDPNSPCNYSDKL
ncbi:unnamed protein product [Psylliodes chrysocephalus]|uniref:Helitron helicase-like domain-containing protein n=1 Tax=Psylliodes chrysocephalus TaxID=3402493 RepID=A0A9P0CYY0_9CUCU|nr:unnamed protein product [Psylliodes chrysocephala]